MVTPAAALLAALALLAGPEQPKQKQSWDATSTPEVRADFLPRSAVIEVDGKVAGKGFVKLDVTDPKRVYKVRVSADGFEPAEAEVLAEKVARKIFSLALRPAGFDRPCDVKDAAAMALAASLLWRSGRPDDAADYAEASLAAGNTALANRILGEVWRQRGHRDNAVRYFTMYLSLIEDSPEAPEIRAWLMQNRPGDIEIPAR